MSASAVSGAGGADGTDAGARVERAQNGACQQEVLVDGRVDAALEERALVERAARGEGAAQEALLRRYLPAVYQVTYRLLGRREQAEDAAQDALVSALRALPRFRGEASFRTWLLRIAANAARSHGRRGSRRREVDLETADHLPADGCDPAHSAEQRVEVARIERLLAHLPPKQRLAVTLRIQQGMSYAEIAAATDSSEGAARVNYHLGIRRLRELLQ